VTPVNRCIGEPPKTSTRSVGSTGTTATCRIAHVRRALPRCSLLGLPSESAANSIISPFAVLPARNRFDPVSDPYGTV
jgi:hypothetical protein